MPRDTPVRDVMTTDVLSFKQADKVQAAAEAMAERSIGGAPVVGPGYCTKKIVPPVAVCISCSKCGSGT